MGSKRKENGFRWVNKTWISVVLAMLLIPAVYLAPLVIVTRVSNDQLSAISLSGNVHPEHLHYSLRSPVLNRIYRPVLDRVKRDAKWNPNWVGKYIVGLKGP